MVTCQCCGVMSACPLWFHARHMQCVGWGRYCEPTGFNSDLTSNVCGVPAALTSLTESVAVYDYLGRQLGGVTKLADIPTVTSYSLFAVLPAGAAKTIDLRPPPSSAPRPSGPSKKGSDIVLEPQFPFLLRPDYVASTEWTHNRCSGSLLVKTLTHAGIIFWTGMPRISWGCRHTSLSLLRTT
jgi:hypothetical protein